MLPLLADEVIVAISRLIDACLRRLRSRRSFRSLFTPFEERVRLGDELLLALLRFDFTLRCLLLPPPPKRLKLLMV